MKLFGIFRRKSYSNARLDLAHFCAKLLVITIRELNMLIEGTTHGIDP
jgi:hypothetical protein